MIEHQPSFIQFLAIAVTTMAVVFACGFGLGRLYGRYDKEQAARDVVMRRLDL